MKDDEVSGEDQHEAETTDAQNCGISKSDRLKYAETAQKQPSSDHEEDDTGWLSL